MHAYENPNMYYTVLVQHYNYCGEAVKCLVENATLSDYEVILCNFLNAIHAVVNTLFPLEYSLFHPYISIIYHYLAYIKENLSQFLPHIDHLTLTFRDCRRHRGAH